MKLFQLSEEKRYTRIASSPSKMFTTPLGEMQFQITLDGFNSSNIDYDYSQVLAQNMTLTGWNCRDFDMEMLFFQKEEGFSKQAVVVRVLTKTAIQEGWGSLYWKEHHVTKGMNLDSGQRLYAKIYEESRYTVLVGTEDDEGLQFRSLCGKGIPHQWASYFPTAHSHWFWSHSIHQMVGDAGIAIPFPPIPAGELCEFVFFVLYGETSQYIAMMDFSETINIEQEVLGLGIS